MLEGDLLLNTAAQVVFFVLLIKPFKIFLPHLKKCHLFYFFFGFSSSCSILNFLTVVSSGAVKASNRSGAAWAVALAISKAFVKVGQAGLLHKLKSCGIPGQMFGFISSFLSYRPCNSQSLCKSILSMVLFLQAPFLVLHFSYSTSMILPMMLPAIFLYRLYYFLL